MQLTARLNRQGLQLHSLDSGDVYALRRERVFGDAVDHLVAEARAQRADWVEERALPPQASCHCGLHVWAHPFLARTYECPKTVRRPWLYSPEAEA